MLQIYMALVKAIVNTWPAFLCRQHRIRICSLITALLYAITAGQVAVYVIALWQNSWLIEQLSHNPLVGPSESALHALGSLSTSDLVDLHQYWRILTSIFICTGARQPHMHPLPIQSAVWHKMSPAS